MSELTLEDVVVDRTLSGERLGPGEAWPCDPPNHPDCRNCHPPFDDGYPCKHAGGVVRQRVPAGALIELLEARIAALQRKLNETVMAGAELARRVPTTESGLVVPQILPGPPPGE